MKTTLLTAMITLLLSGAFAQQDSAVIFYQSGLEKVHSRLYNAATLDFEKAMELRPDYLDAIIANAKTNLLMNRRYQAQQGYKKAYALSPQNMEVLRALMLLNFNARQNQESIELAERCRGCEGVNRIIGISYYRMENYGKTIEYLQKAVKEDENDAEALYTLGRTYLEMDNMKEAVPYYEKAIKADPKKDRWMYELALVNYNLGNWPQAVKYFEMAKEAGYRQSNDFLENFGFAMLYAGQLESGLKMLDHLMEKKPGNRTLLTDIAYTMYETEKYDEAIRFFEKLLTINPNDARSLFMAGMSFQKKGQKQKGQAICDKAIEMDPSLARNRHKKKMPMGL